MSRDLPPEAEQEKRETKINCFSCQHFYITYDQSFPYGCRAAGFKSRVLPSKEMYVNSGIDCLLLAKKDKTR